MGINDMMNSAKGMMDKAQGNDGQSGGMADLMSMAKGIDMAEIERYKSMSKTELMDELKNSEHKDTVVNFIKGLIAQKSGS